MSPAWTHKAGSEPIMLPPHIPLVLNPSQNYFWHGKIRVQFEVHQHMTFLAVVSLNPFLECVLCDVLAAKSADLSIAGSLDRLRPPPRSSHVVSGSTSRSPDSADMH